ncbi:DUF559 domain-containing protein [Demequina aurantiaca]|uniref:DUF559 domain-containing protein n=1 Tax=Demequina aurantiaca TaxID=676200 RepID=UPI003D33CE20
MANTTARDRLRDLLAMDARSYSGRELTREASRQAMRTALRKGELVRLLPNVFVSAVHSDSFAARAHAARRWAGSRASVAGAAALFAWGGLAEPPHEVHIVVPHGTGLRPPPWVRLSRASYPYLTAQWRDGTLMTPEFALLQAFGLLPHHQRDAVLYSCINKRIVDPAALVDALRTTPRVRDRRRLEATTNAALLGAESFLEQNAADVAFACPPLKDLLRQHRLRVGTDRFRCDFYHAQTRTAIELDGAAYHSELGAREADIRRDAKLASIGVLTVRFGYKDIVSRPLWCREILVGILENRGGATPA